LGSCTMKLNAATEMAGITWAEFNAVHPFAPREDVTGYLEMIAQPGLQLGDHLEVAGVHPFAPREDVTGYLEMIAQLETWLADLTGYDTVSLQPNAGSQGEFA